MKIAVTAAPVDNQANDQLRRVLARALDLSLSQVDIARGQTSRRKLVRAQGITIKETQRKLGAGKAG